MASDHAWRLIVRTVFLILAVVLGLIFLWHIREIVALVLAAAVVAAGVAPVAYWISSQRIGPRGWHLSPVFGVLLVYLVLAVVFGVVSSIVFPPVFHNVQELILAAPQIAENLENVLDRQREFYPWLPQLEIDQQLLLQGANQLRGLAPNAFNIFFGFVNSIFQALFVLVLALYITIEAPSIRDFILRLVPRDQRQHVIEVTEEIAWRTGRWVVGQLVLATVVGAGVGIVMLLLDIPYPFALAFVAFIGELIPMVGPIITGVCMAMVALTTSPPQFVLTVAWSILVQQLENNLLVPRIVGTAVGISPLAVILALLIGGSLLGFVGAMLAVPVAAALQVLANRLIEIREAEEDRKQKAKIEAAVRTEAPIPAEATDGA
jgi:predicted PurR-regulated permease PerM